MCICVSFLMKLLKTNAARVWLHQDVMAVRLLLGYLSQVP